MLYLERNGRLFLGPDLGALLGKRELFFSERRLLGKITCRNSAAPKNLYCEGEKMSEIDVARAWKDEEYRNSLSESERASLPPNPAGASDLSDQDLEDVSGGTGVTINEGTCQIGSLGCKSTECGSSICPPQDE